MRPPRSILLTICFISLVSALWAQTLGPKNGALYIHGGGKVNTGEFVNLIKYQTGKEDPVIRVITTAQGRKRQPAFEAGEPWQMVTKLRERFNLTDVAELYPLSAKEANDPKFFEQIDQADAVFMSGGNQSHLTDAFLGTESFAALKRLLDRGGVIGGSSAGAQVQSSFMTRGDFKKRVILGDKKHQHGFGFITNSAFDVHVEERSREHDLFEVFNANPSHLQDRNLETHEILGIGIDQRTAVTVMKNRLRVSGPGLVRIFDPRQWSEDQAQFYVELKNGDLFNLKTRRRSQKKSKPSDSPNLPLS